MASSATDVFVSYKAEDRARLMPLVKALEAEGFTVWWDAHIGGGTDWREEIQQHLDAARCVIVAWSQRSVGPEGRFVRDEASTAQEAGSYIPIKIDAVKPPLGFGEVQAMDFVGWKGKRAAPCFVALVDAVNAHLTGEAPVVRRTAVAEPTVSRRTVIAGGVGALAVAGGGGWALLKPGAAAASNRIAVMSFSNMSGDPAQAYFSDGIAEELRGALSRVGMQVIGKASCDAVKALDIPAAAAKLEVANILTGSVRRSPETIRVAAQLVNGKDGVEKWGQSYDRAPGDTIKIQTDIAAQVASALSIALGAAKKAALTIGGTKDPVAQDLYLQALALYSNDGGEDATRRSVQLLDSATKRDPKYANAFSAKANMLDALASSYPHSAIEVANGLNKAELAAKKAIALAPTLGAGYAVLAAIEQDRFNFAKALKYIRRAIALSPEDLQVLTSATYARWYIGGNPLKALSVADSVIELDPLKASGYSRRSSLLIELRKYDEAIGEARKSLRLAPSREWPHQLIGDAFILMDRPDEAKAEYNYVAPDDLYRLRSEAVIAGRSGKISEVTRILSRMRTLFANSAMFQFAQVFAQAQQKDSAFEALEKAFEVKDIGLTGVRTDPFIEPIRNDPRYAAFVKKLNFPIWP